jgi:hypothetical protein
VAKSDERGISYGHEIFRFPLRIPVSQDLCGNGALLQKAAIDHAWEEEQEYQ